jgi:hypothetical protein
LTGEARVFNAASKIYTTYVDFINAAASVIKAVLSDH